MMISKKVYEKLETELINVRSMEISSINALADSLALVYESIKNPKTTVQVQPTNCC